MKNHQTLDAPAESAPTTRAEAQATEEKCLEFARTLGMEQPVSVAVLEAALRDETYARNLLTSRRSPALLKHLLAHPPKPRQPESATPQFSNAELAKRAAAALLRWGAVGFSVVDKATLERRRAACLSCPHLTGPPDKLIYKLTLPNESDMICGLCGCNVRKKMKLPTESCPASNPEAHGMSRWGEPMEVETGVSASG